MRTYIALTFSFLLFGCATSPVSIENANKVEKERLYDPFYKYSVANIDKGKGVIVRDSGLFGGGVSAALFVNGELISHIERGEYVTLYLDEGDQLIGVLPELIISSEPDTSDLIEQPLRVEKGKSYNFRISIINPKGLVLQRTSQL